MAALGRAPWPSGRIRLLSVFDFGGTIGGAPDGKCFAGTVPLLVIEQPPELSRDATLIQRSADALRSVGLVRASAALLRCSDRPYSREPILSLGDR